MQLYALIGQVLVLLATCVIALMPWTEHYWTFDGFLRGNPDFELGLLALIVMLCLALLLAAMAKHGIRVLLSLRRSSFPADGGFQKFIRRACRKMHVEMSVSSGFSLPLQI